MVTIDAEGTWDDMIKKVTGASDVKKKSFRLYDEWVEIFGKDRATGELAETPFDVEEEIERMKNSGDNKCDNNYDTDYVNIDVINKGTERKNNEKKRGRGEVEENGSLIRNKSFSKQWNNFLKRQVKVSN